jgi:hypothetical protein
MSRQGMDADTAETLAGAIRLCVGPLSWSGWLLTTRVPGRLDNCSGWALTWPRTRRGTCFRTRCRSTGRCRSGTDRAVSYGLLSSCCGA